MVTPQVLAGGGAAVGAAAARRSRGRKKGTDTLTLSIVIVLMTQQQYLLWSRADGRKETPEEDQNVQEKEFGEPFNRTTVACIICIVWSRDRYAEHGSKRCPSAEADARREGGLKKANEGVNGQLCSSTSIKRDAPSADHTGVAHDV